MRRRTRAALAGWLQHERQSRGSPAAVPRLPPHRRRASRRAAARPELLRPSPARGGRHARLLTRSRTLVSRTYWPSEIGRRCAARSSRTAPSTSASSLLSCSPSSPMRTGCTRGGSSSARSPTPDTRPLYYFSPTPRGAPGPAQLSCRSPSTRSAAGGCVRYDRKAFPRELDTRQAGCHRPTRQIYAGRSLSSGTASSLASSATR